MPVGGAATAAGRRLGTPSRAAGSVSATAVPKARASAAGARVGAPRSRRASARPRPARKTPRTGPKGGSRRSRSRTPARPATLRKAPRLALAAVAAAIPARAQPAGAGAGRVTGGFQRLPDAGLLVRISRGSRWIAVLGVLLLGIVAVNVATLRLGAGTGQTAERIQGFSQRNSELRALLAQRSATETVRAEAAGLGMVMPEPGALRYLSLGAGSAERAAERLREIGAAGPAAPPAPAPAGADTPAGAEVAAPTPVPNAEPSAPGAPAEPAPASPGAGGGGPP